MQPTAIPGESGKATMTNTIEKKTLQQDNTSQYQLNPTHGARMHDQDKDVAEVKGTLHTAVH